MILPLVKLKVTVLNPELILALNKSVLAIIHIIILEKKNNDILPLRYSFEVKENEYMYYTDFWTWYDVWTFMLIQEHSIFVARAIVFNIYGCVYHRRANISKSGFLARIGKLRKRGK